MTMAITRRTARRSEPCLNELEGPSVVEPMLSVRQCTSSNNMVEMDCPAALPKVGSSLFSRRQRHRVLSTPSTPLSSPTSSSFSWRQLWIPQDAYIERMKQYIRSKKPRHVAIMALLFFIVLWIFFSILLEYLFGPHGSIKGGQFGYLVDQNAKDYVRYHTISKWREEIRSKLHIPLVHSERDGTLLEPRFWPFDVMIKTRPNVAVVEMLLREKIRVQNLHDRVQSVAHAIALCKNDPSFRINIPRVILQFENSLGEINQLLPYWITRGELLEIDSFAVHKKDISTIASSIDLQSCRRIVSGFENYAISTDIDLHCLAFSLGGMQLSNSIMKQHRPLVENILNMVKVESAEGSCSSKVGYAVLSNTPAPYFELRKTSSIMSYISTIFSALPPKHPGYLCLPPFHDDIGISPYTEANLELSFQSIFVNRLATTISHARSNLSMNNTDTLWGIVSFHCDFEKKGLSCCNEAIVSVKEVDMNDPNFLESTLQEEKRKSGPNQHLIFTVSDITGHVAMRPSSVTHLSVSINEEKQIHPTVANRSKWSIQKSLETCQPGWWCNRCLQTPLYGSFSKCKSVCADCVSDVICDVDKTKRHQTVVNVHAKKIGIQLKEQRIPRIIHQTWFEDITIERYPHLYRLQNIWRASGWEYRFYTDDTARKYIQDNYPPRFVTVFDAIVPGAYKADFFRYLVLYKDGGIYADIDVMLDANLDSFITSNLAFFAPIDAVGSYADEQFCIWNGLIGSAPAHPILTNVIEWMVNLVSSRGDIYDMERLVCQFSGGKDRIENWKLRTEPSLMLSGPCALGLAINNALGNQPLAKFDSGLIKQNHFNQRQSTAVDKDLIGDVMVLEADKQDLGAFRFSDPERNIVVATTDMSSLSKSPMIYEAETSDDTGMVRTGVKKVKPHYSISTKGQQLWGTHDVYSDELVLDEHVSLTVTFEEQ